MAPQDNQSNANGTNSGHLMLGSNFTVEEAARLLTLRESFHARAEYLEQNVDECRVEFVRWLIATGRIGEQI